jgi:type IV secretory pathway VirB10-like protein
MRVSRNLVHVLIADVLVAALTVTLAGCSSTTPYSGLIAQSHAAYERPVPAGKVKSVRSAARHIQPQPTSARTPRASSVAEQSGDLVRGSVKVGPATPPVIPISASPPSDPVAERAGSNEAKTFTQQLNAAIAAASLDDLDQLARTLSQGRASGMITDDDAQRLAARIEARRTSARQDREMERALRSICRGC